MHHKVLLQCKNVWGKCPFKPVYRGSQQIPPMCKIVLGNKAFSDSDSDSDHQTAAEDSSFQPF